MNIDQAHAKFGHTNEEDTRKTAKELGIVITRRTLCPCEARTVAKAKQKNVIKKSAHKAATKTGARHIFIDISAVKKTKKGKDLARPNWYLTVDERTQLKFSKFYPKKNDMIEPACAQLQKWKQAGLGVTHIRMDKAGENTKLQARAESAAWKLGVQFEYTARDTPQQNHLVKLGFAILGAGHIWSRQTYRWTYDTSYFQRCSSTRRTRTAYKL
jgi:L-rhamnose isomerase